MKRPFILGLLFLSSLTRIDPGWAQYPNTGILIHPIGKFAGKDVIAKDGEKWFGLYPTNPGEFELVVSTVFLIPFRDHCMGDAENQATGREVRVDNVTAPLILIRGLDTLREGAIETCFFDREHKEYGRIVYPGQVIDIRMKGNNQTDSTRYDMYTLHACGEAKPTNSPPNPIVMENYFFQLCRIHSFARDSPLHQNIISFPGFDLEGFPTVIWAGDVDRDGRLDLLLNSRTSYAADEYALFLSSQAEQGQLVKLVAKFLVPSC